MPAPAAGDPRMPGIGADNVRMLVVVLGVVRGQRTPQQHRDDHRKDNHFLEGAGVERRVGFKQADQQGAESSDRIRGEAADNGADETLEADQETGIVVDGRDRCDQDAREGADRCREGEAQLAGQYRRNPHQAGPRAVHRGGAQRLAVDGALEEEIKSDDQKGRGDDNQNGLPLQRRVSQFEADVGKCRRPRALGTEEKQPEADQRQVHGHRDDQQDKHRSARHRLVGQAIDHRTQRHDQQHRQHDLRRQRQLRRRHDEQATGKDQRNSDVVDQQRWQLAEAPLAQETDAI